MATWTVTILSTRPHLRSGLVYYSFTSLLRFILVFDVSISKEETGVGKNSWNNGEFPSVTGGI